MSWVWFASGKVMKKYNLGINSRFLAYVGGNVNHLRWRLRLNT